MKAFIVEKADGPFREIDMAVPVPAPGQVLVKIHASGINPLDTKIRAGSAAHARQPLPAVLGIDMSGTVEDVGPGVTEFRAGDEVFGMVGGVGGLQGTLAEFVAADAALLAHKPKPLSWRQAAALPLATITAWEGLIDRAKVRAGQTVLVYAGTGGVGYVAVQIALARGAKVFATVSEDKRSLVESLGATAIGRNTPVEQYRAAHTAGEGFDVTFDTVGGVVLDESFSAVKRYSGHAVSCLGWGAHSLAPLSFRGATYSGVFTLYPLLSGNGRSHHGEILREVSKWMEQGKLKPLLAQQQFGRDDIATAYELVARGNAGKVVIEIEENNS